MRNLFIAITLVICFRSDAAACSIERIPMSILDHFLRSDAAIIIDLDRNDLASGSDLSSLVDHTLFGNYRGGALGIPVTEACSHPSECYDSDYSDRDSGWFLDQGHYVDCSMLGFVFGPGRTVIWLANHEEGWSALRWSGLHRTDGRGGQSVSAFSMPALPENEEEEYLSSLLGFYQQAFAADVDAEGVGIDTPSLTRTLRDSLWHRWPDAIENEIALITARELSRTGAE